MSTYSLEDLKADVEKEFAPVVLTYAGEEFKLRHMFRLTDEERATVFDTLERVSKDTDADADSEDMTAMSEAVWQMLKVLPEGNKGQKLIDALGYDLALGMKVVGIYTEVTQPGEASDSSN